MANVFVLDTHALIWFLQGDPRLGAGALAAIGDPDSLLIVPAIALAEALWIVERGKTNIPSPQALLDALNADGRLVFSDLDWRTLERTVSLTSITEMHDRQIVATTLCWGLPGNPASLITMDAEITGSAIVPVVW